MRPKCRYCPMAVAPPAPPGRIVNGRHVRVIGADDPRLLCEAGTAATPPHWPGLQRPLATSLTTCSYDRPGDGRRAPSTGAVTLRALAGDLHALVQRIPARPPLVLVGHSFGSYIVRTYAHRFPEDVAALVLIDPVTADEWTAPGWRGRLRLRRA